MYFVGYLGSGRWMISLHYLRRRKEMNSSCDVLRGICRRESEVVLE